MKNQTLGEAAEIGGVHLEGPFISKHKVKAQTSICTTSLLLKKFDIFKR